MVVPSLLFVVNPYNEDHEIVHCLQAIENQRGLSNYEIIVVDDGSPDQSAEVVKMFALTHSGVQLTSQPNARRGAARATGLIGVAQTVRQFFSRASPCKFLSFTLALIAKGSIVFYYFIGRLVGIATPSRVLRW